jgi:hypothetical protein
MSHLKLASYKVPPFPLKVVEIYKYLGVKFNSYVPQIFKQHWEDILTAVKQRSYLVSRAIRHVSTPIMVGIQLVVSIVRSKMAYALALINTTKKEIFKKLQSLIVSSLKIILGLPRSAPSESVLVECGISDIEIWKEKLSLQFAERLSKLPPNHHSFTQFYSHDFGKNSPPRNKSPIYKNIIESIGAKIKKIESDIDNRWEVRDHREIDLRKLKFRELFLTHSKWFNSNTSVTLRLLRPSIPSNFKREFYLLHDLPHISRLRARFRFDRYPNMALLYKYQKVPSPACPFCNSLYESSFHILLECPQYRDQRQELIRKLYSLWSSPPLS